jgi:hypothetical protein
MAYTHTNSKGQAYTLHRREAALRNGQHRVLYFFSREVNAADAVEAVPDGYVVTELRTGLPALKRA